MKNHQKQLLSDLAEKLRHREYLVDSYTEIKLGKPLALKKGGVVLIKRDAVQFNGTSDIDLFEIVLEYFHDLNPTRPIYLGSPRHHWPKHIHFQTMTRAAVCDYRNFRHDYRPANDFYKQQYEIKKQQVFAYLRTRNAKNSAAAGRMPPPDHDDGFFNGQSPDTPPYTPPPANDNGHAAPLTPEQEAILSEITQIAATMDVKFFGLFGVDALLDLPFLNFIGAPAAALPALWIVLRAKMLGLPSEKLVRMLANIGLDTGLGLIPIPAANMVADALYKANIKNLNIVRAHFSQPPYKKQ
jgi:Domain of unknown function (DUF4112)